MFSVKRKLSDDQMECMQFGICDYAPRQVHEVPFFSLLITKVTRFSTFLKNYQIIDLANTWH